jgi:uncharacterized membrane protein YidH (DUF202 family)
VIKKVRSILLLSAIIITICELFIIDYNNLFILKNKGSFLVIISMAMLNLSIILSNKNDKKIKQQQEYQDEKLDNY